MIRFTLFRNIQIMGLILGFLLIAVTVQLIRFFQNFINFKPDEHYLSQEQSAKGIVTLNEVPLCSLQFLKDYAKMVHDYPNFSFHSLYLTKKQVEFTNVSSGCQFPNKNDPRKRRDNLDCNYLQTVSNNILLMGDSQGRRYRDALIAILDREGGWRCGTIKEEYSKQSNQPDRHYYVREPTIKLSDIKYRSRDCHGCKSVLSTCRKKGKTLNVEYLATQFFIDTEVTTVRTRKGTCLKETFCEHSDSYQEFIFREYLAGRYPDVVLFFASDHDKNRHSLKRIRLTAEYFFRIVESYLPSNSIFVLMNIMKQMTLLQPPKWRDARYEQNMTANELLRQENKIIYDVISSRLIDPNKRWYVFPTLFDDTNSTDHLYVDAIHRSTAWYRNIARSLLYLICL